MAAATQSRTMARINGFIGLLIGIFGALAILGMLMKIMKFQSLGGIPYETIVLVGFGGEIGAFLIMGIVQFAEGWMAKGAPKSAVGAAETGVAGGAYYALNSKEMVDDLHKAVKERVTAEVGKIMGTFGQDMQRVSGDLHKSILEAVQPKLTAELSTLTQGLGQVMTGLGEDIKRFGGEMRHMSGEMQHARAAVHSMRETLNKAATGSLPADAEALGTGMRQLSDEMKAAGSEAHNIRHELTTVSLRFKQFNNPIIPRENGNGTHADVAAHSATGR